MRLAGPQPGSFEGDPTQGDALAAQRSVTVEDGNVVVPQPAAYLELGWRPLPQLLLTPGARVDYYGEIRQASIDPRFSARFEVTPQTAVKGGVGYYSQPPQSWQSIPGIGNPDLKPFRALQTSLGVEQKLGDAVKVTAEGFFKRVHDIVVGTENRQAPQYVNEGEGRIYGAEVSGEARWRAEGFAYLAYTLSRSERRREGSDWRLFDSDQTHVLTLAANQGLGGGWDVGVRFRVVSGNPTTPVTGSVYDARTGVYLPTYAATNSARDGAFHQLDARVEKDSKHRFDVALSEQDRDDVPHLERLDPERESLQLSHFISAGDLSRAFQTISWDSDDLLRSTTWTAPKQAGLVRFWVVLRDFRGGNDLTERSVCVQ